MTSVCTASAPWGALVERQSQDASFYYSREWLDLISKHYGYAVIPLTTVNAAGEITGFLPVCSMWSPIRGRRLVALPFSDYCPPVASGESSAHELVDQAIALARQEKARYLELRAGVYPALGKRTDLVEGNLYVRWLTPLALDSTVVWSKLKPPVQRQIKKARKLGVRVRTANSAEDMARYYRLHLQTRCRKHGMPAQSLQFFLALWDTFAPGEVLKLLLAEYQGSVIAGVILIAFGPSVRYAYGASDPRSLHLAPNNLLLWEAIEWGCASRFRTLDLGRTACDNQGLMAFKSGWGAVREPLPYYYYPRRAGLAATSEQSWKYRLFTGCWKRLPLTVAEPLGGMLYKYLG
jgi:CelD/BcsL family acetyltransferase involved in cellulose biosynthesis